MNKTVCIYPKDESTDFLSPLYDFLCEKDVKDCTKIQRKIQMKHML